MEEFFLFNELNITKNEIDKDLFIIEKMNSHLKFKNVNDNNKQLEEKIQKLTADFNFKFTDLKNKNGTLEREVNKCRCNLDEKNDEILIMKEKLKDVIEENNNIYANLNNLKSDNFKMNKIIMSKEEQKEMERLNREYLKVLFENEIRDTSK